ncbi:MAG: hypothetical protein QNJ58_25865, partial [Desulfobacterales bacterium]|nr:hypothetical protein [Desulfobacterales bacterium]
ISFCSNCRNFVPLQNVNVSRKARLTGISNHIFFEAEFLLDLLEEHAILGVNDILVCQMNQMIV